MRAILIVRLGALGDIVHALPVAAALRERYPDARIDWVVDERHLPLLELVSGLDHRIPLASRSAGPIARIRRLRPTLRAARYDLAVDVQGLLKSAVVARLSGAARILGFARGALREPAARVLYTETCDPGPGRHVVDKNLALAVAAGAAAGAPRFPLEAPASAALDAVRTTTGGRPFAVVNPGAAWPNKRWPPARFGALARALAVGRGLPVVVLWGPEDGALAEAVVGAADTDGVRQAPATGLGDLAAILGAAALVVSGDTGPLHLAAALGTPVVALHGPTDPARNGPWSAADVAVSRHGDCVCARRRRCRLATPCLEAITVEMATAAVDRRLERVAW